MANGAPTSADTKGNEMINDSNKSISQQMGKKYFGGGTIQHRQRVLREVGTPSNPTKFLRDGARYGAVKVTSANGTVRYFVGAQTHYFDIDAKKYYSPIFAPTNASLCRAFRESVEMGQLD